MGCVGASNARRTFHAVNSQLGSPGGKAGVPDLASAAVRNASRSLVQHEAPLQLKHWPHLPTVGAFQASSQLLSIVHSPVLVARVAGKKPTGCLCPGPCTATLPMALHDVCLIKMDQASAFFWQSSQPTHRQAVQKWSA